MAKYVSQEEAAKMLGVSLDELKAMRDRRELLGIRGDGAAFKYKADEVERLVNDRASAGSGLGWESAADDSILLSEKELGQSEGTLSTIIGKMPSSESDIRIGGAPDGGSDLNLNLGSDVRLAPDSAILGGSAAGNKTPGGKNLSSSDSGKGKSTDADFDDLDLSLDLDLDEPSSPAAKKGDGSSLSLDDDLKLESPSGFGSAVNLADDDDDDLVLGGGSDITVSATDSGIGLGSPSDSGISLDQPLELGGSNVEMLELGEDDVISLDHDVDLESATQLKADDDFLLTPVDEDDNEGDSGSQVIALDTEDDLGSVAGMFGSSSPGMAQMLAEDSGGFNAGAMGAGPAILATGAGLTTAQYVPVAAAPPEAPYSIFNVLGLAACVLLLAVGGMMVADLMRNMWSWDQTAAINSSLIESLGGTFGMLDSK